jgi:superfamily II DNA or RNA helicase
MINLRPFQQRGVQGLRSLFPTKKKLVLCSPTGSGKTFTACEIVRLAREKKNTCCILVHREELLKQFNESLGKFGMFPELIYSGSKFEYSNLYLGMAETFYRRLDKPECKFLEDIDLLIFDEAHSSIYYKIIERFNGKFMIGLTATPQASAAARPMNEYYDDIVELAKTTDLIKDGFLVDARTFSIPLQEEKKLLKKKGADFSEESQLEFFHTPKVFEGDLDNYRSICEGKKFIIYAVNVSHSIECANKFTKAGYPCKHLDGNTPKGERDLILSQLKKGEILGISNFGIVTAGFDEDSIECIIQNFATSELSKHIQTAGRGARPRDGKHEFFIIDMGANYSRHGRWNSDRDWIDIFRNPNSKEERDRQKTEDKSNLMCETCGFILSIKDEICPHCNTNIQSMLKEKLKDLTGVKAKEIREELKSRVPPRLRKSFSSMSPSELMEYADLIGYKKSWAFKQLELRQKTFVRKINR